MAFVQVMKPADLIEKIAVFERLLDSDEVDGLFVGEKVVAGFVDGRVTQIIEIVLRELGV